MNRVNSKSSSLNNAANNAAKSVNIIANNAAKSVNNAAKAANNAAKAANNVANNAAKAANNTSMKGKLQNGIEKITGQMKLVSGGRAAVTILGLIILILLGYSLSHTYRISNVLDGMNIYNDLLTLDPRYISNMGMLGKKLKDVHVATAYRPYLGKNQLLDYCSLEVLDRTMACGARCLYIDVFNSDLSMNADPIVCNGFEMGNWKLSLNRINFEDVIRHISNAAFQSGYVQNYNDPLFLAINLKTNGNHYCVDKVKNIIVKYLKSRLLPSKFTNQQQHLGDTNLIELMGKVVIMCSSGYQHTELEELVNASWDKDNFNQIPFDSLGGDPEMQDPRTILLDKYELKYENEKNLCLVTPPNDTFFTYNYEPLPYMKAGCQFIAMNYQATNDDEIIKYVNNYFRESSIVEKQELD